jgi:hypothetical protein
MSFRDECDVFYESDAICDKTTGKTKTARQTALIKKSVPNFRKKTDLKQPPKKKVIIL